MVVGLGVVLVLAARAVEGGQGFAPCAASANSWNGRTPGIIALEFAGDADRADRLLDCWDDSQRRSLRDGVDADTWLILAYVATIGFWCAYGIRHLYRPALRRLGWFALGGVVVAGALDLAVENPALRSILDGDNGAATRATAAAVPKWVLLVLAAVYAVSAAVVALTRLAVRVAGSSARAAFRAPPGFGPADAPPVPAPTLVDVVEAEDASTFARRYVLPGAGEPGGFAIALSGGGVRSAAFSLGCVQAFDELAYPDDPSGRTVMASARHLATVSGGGYLGGARQLLLHDLAARGAAAPVAYAPGAPETASLHSNHNYLWDTPREAATGVVRLVVGIGVNISVLAALVFVVARALGWSTFAPLLGRVGPASAPTGFWWGTTLAVGLLLVMALLGGLIHAKAEGGGPFVARAVQLAVLVPGVIGILLFLVGWRGPDLARARVPLIAGVGTAVVLLAAAALCWLTPPLRRLAKPIRTSLPAWVLGALALGLTAYWIDGAAAEIDDLRPSLGPPLRLVLGVAVVVAVILTVFSLKPVRNWMHGRALVAQFAVIGAPAAIGLLGALALMVRGDWLDVRVSERVLWSIVVVALVGLYAFGDQKLWSPHLFYKRRLASAFSATRARPEAPPQQIPYNIRTTMSAWGRPTPGSPELLVCCAVHTSNLRVDRHRRVWSFTFAHDYVGGPDIGWMRTIDLEAALGRENGGDGTLLAAMAISGAAVASSLGSLSKGGSNAAIAVANARLGVWLPNPRYVRRLREQPDDEVEPWIRWRRFTYLLKEVFGVFDLDDRFVYVSDGGHLENFGLVELLARRPAVVVCCDASGDVYDDKRGPSSAAGSLRHSLRIAKARLGITIEAVPASGAPFPVDLDDDRVFGAAVAAMAPTIVPSPGNEALAGRIAADCVATFGIGHPAAPGAPDTLLVLAKAVLTPDVCTDPALAPIRDAAVAFGHFPNDSTIDQWLTTAQFDGYRALGRHVAARACTRLGELLSAGSTGVGLDRGAGADEVAVAVGGVDAADGREVLGDP